MTHYPISFPRPVRRIHVAWRKGQWSVESEIRIESMTLPRSHELPAAGRGVSGFWFEAVDDQGRAVYRQIMPDPFSEGMEVFNDDGTISRKPHRMPAEVLFDVLIPDLPQITELHFYSSARQDHGRERHGAAERVAALDVRTRKGGSHGCR